MMQTNCFTCDGCRLKTVTHKNVKILFESSLLPMVPVGSLTGWCLPSPCVQWDKATSPSAFFLPTTSTNGTTWISNNAGLCVFCTHAWMWVCWCLGVGVAFYLVLISILKSEWN